MENNRLGLFGGTFDPPHLGHVAALEAAWRTGRFDRLLVTVAGDPYQKSGGRSISSSATRLQMARAAFEGLPGVEVSDLEIRRGGPSYTVDTVEDLVDQGWLVQVLVGADAAQSLDLWHDAQRLMDMATISVFPRASGFTPPSGAWKLEILDMEPVDLSSSWIRAHRDLGEEIAKFLPEKVIPLYLESQR